MRRSRLPSLLVPLVVLTSCGEDQPPTAPAGPGAPALNTAGQRVVNSLADPGDGICDARQCTLREAINDPGSTSITFAPGLTGAITLARPVAGGGLLKLERSLTITGPSGGITIRRRSTDPEFRIVRVGSGVTVGLSNVAVRNGKTSGAGGGLLNWGTATLTDCTIAGNAAAQNGGGIDNHGVLTLTRTTVSDNTGVGIYNHNNATLTLAGSTVARNTGGIVNFGGTVTATRSAIGENASFGISAERGTTTLLRVRVVDNTGSGIVAYRAHIAVTGSTVARNTGEDGGGIFNQKAWSMTIENSTIVANVARNRGGGIFNTVDDPFERQGSRLSLTNSTVVGNSALTGGGIQNTDYAGGAQLDIINSTITGNSARDGGGGILQSPGWEGFGNRVSLTNTLVAHNTAPAGPDLLGDYSAIYSLVGDGSGSGVTNTDGNQVGNVSPNTSPIEPLLGPLTNNGGPTRTHALLSGSPAIDAASAEGCPATDQRGVGRPQGPACDIGSYEREE